MEPKKSEHYQGVICSAGYYDSSGSCIGCITGYYNNIALSATSADCKSCTTNYGAGYYAYPGGTACYSCGLANYIPSRTATSCGSICSAGYYVNSYHYSDCSVTGATSSSVCSACVTGKTNDSLHQSCVDCSAGTYWSSYNCIQCSAGSYQSNPGQTSCIQCSLGTYASALGLTSCTQCALNTYAGSIGSISCTSCSFGMFSNPGSASCHAVCGDGLKASVEGCDDHNMIDGDGCSSSCIIEPGYICKENPSTSPSVCNTVCGDGKRAGSEVCDDGNLKNGDGCSSACLVETRFQCTGGTPTTPDTCHDICGDGIVVFKTGTNCDDGNTIGGDGCSSICAIEKGWDCTGGSISSPDHCSTVCGDGVLTTQYEQCDDGNRINGDGCNIYCQIEPNCFCSTNFSAPINSICSEICGDGKNMGLNPCDDGNVQSGDGCSSSCTIETGFLCAGGTPTKRDICTEKCGDALDFGFNECEDGNLNNSDGCSSTCEFETCYECKGSTPTSIDTCSKLFITPSLKSISSSNMIEITFNHTMRQVNITLDFLSISIIQDYPIIFSWSAYYSDNQTLSIRINSQTVLTGNENISIKFINYKIWRGPFGGCLTTNQLSTTAQNSLADSVAVASSISSFTQYSSYIGIAVTVALVLIGGGSLEMIWALINTLQIVSYLPLMTPFFPEPVRVMFIVLKFANMNFDFLSEAFYKLTSISILSTTQYNSLFTQNGIDTPLFLMDSKLLI